MTNCELSEDSGQVVEWKMTNCEEESDQVVETMTNCELLENTGQVVEWTMTNCEDDNSGQVVERTPGGQQSSCRVNNDQL